MKKSCSQSRMAQSKPRRGSTSGKINIHRDHLDRGEEQGHLLGESDGSSTIPLQDSSLHDGKARNRRRENCGKAEADSELGFGECSQLLYSAEFECIISFGDTQSTQSARFEPHSKCKEICRIKFRNHRRRRLGVAEQLPHISCLRSTSRESLLESATTTQRNPKDNGRLRGNTLIW